MLARATTRERWDIVVIGGGATGAGVALDAATRGYRVLLLERGDFGCGTSSRSTKLAHGGVRYLQQGRVGLVMEALRERGRLRRNAPRLVHDLAFVLPCFSWRELAVYGVGLTAYDVLAGRHRLGRSRIVAGREVVRRLPTVRTERICGGVVYHDGQFDDARLLISLVITAAEYGAVALNYAPVMGLIRGTNGQVDGVVAVDAESGTEFVASARVVVNAAGPFCDDVRRLADPEAAPLVAASRGSHVVLDRSFLPGDDALLIPETSDGRVLFAIPWLGHVLVGTTDVPIPEAVTDPHPGPDEIDFILETAGRYLVRPPGRADVLSTFAGVRPLVRAGPGRTAELARDHLICVEASGLVTITGGKWTTYRSMAEACVDRAASLAGLPRRPCRTRTLPLQDDPIPFDGVRLDARLPYTIGDVVRGVKTEMARTVEDVLARRTRALFLNEAAAVTMAPRVAEVMAGELGKDADWSRDQVQAFEALASCYRA
jgi:glycerol-3-phosphate dehydrogenase